MTENDIVDLDSNLERTQVTFEQIFDIDEIQILQDSFSAATGVASIITDPDGNPITVPSNFSSLCQNVIRKTEKGLNNCKLSDSYLGGLSVSGPKMQPCLSCGLMDGGTSIIVDGNHIANWLIGQVLTEEQTEEGIISYADDIGVDRELFKNELLKVNRMSTKRFSDICNYLYVNAQMLSKYAYKSQQLTVEVVNRKTIESQLHLAYREVESSYEELITIEEELREQNTVLREKEQALIVLNQALDISETHYRTIVENIPGGVFNFDNKGMIIGCNSKFEDILELASEDVIGTHMANLADENLSESIKACMKGESVHYKGPYSSPVSTSTKFISAILTPIMDDSGHIQSGQGLIFDHTDLNIIEQNLFKQTETLKALFKNSPYGIIQFDDKHYAVDVNDTFCTMFGYERAETIGREVDSLIAKEVDHKEVSVYSKILLSGKSVSLKGRRTGKNQKEIMTSIVGVPVIYEDQVIGGFAVYADLTEEESTKQELIKAKDQAELAHRIKTDFLANMSHEMRTPMNGILGMIQLLQMTPLDSNQRECVEMSKTASESLLSVVNGILDYTNIEAGRVGFLAVEFDLRKLIEEIVALFTPTAVGKQLTINRVVDDNIPFKIIGDEFKIKQVLSNLVGNAVKFTQKGAVSITIKHISDIENQKLNLEFCISDTGIGIEKEKQHLLFERFSQIDNSSTREYGGTGLGLAISKGIITHMGGDIWVESEMKVGSNFYFTCPLSFKSHYDDALTSKASMATLSETKTKKRPLKVLLAEDDLINQTVMSKLFAKQGWELTAVSNGRLALEAYKNNTFDVIVMDCQMPELNGYETTQTIRTLENGERKIPIIAMTAGALESDSKRCFDAGMTTYFSKPIVFKEFIQHMYSYEEENQDDIGKIE